MRKNFFVKIFCMTIIFYSVRIVYEKNYFLAFILWFFGWYVYEKTFGGKN